MSALPPWRRRRALTSDDRAVWDAVAGTADRLEREKRNKVVPGARAPERPERPERPITHRPARPAPCPAKGPAKGPPPRATLRPVGPSSPHRVSAVLHDPAPRPVGRPEAGLDRRTAERLRRGERDPDARIDLHGLTAERAHHRLDRFIAEALFRGARCVLVITGKGGRHDTQDSAPFLAPGRGVLRDAAPRWLRTGPHARQIVGIYEAHRRHGGGGAFYVYLKRRR
ncbi:MAG: Smr/MutS family protein [Pseudomonadota bacterium]